MKTKKTIDKKRNEICGIAGQLAVIALFAVLFFAAACVSPLVFAWPEDFLTSVRTGFLISGALFILLGGVWAVPKIRAVRRANASAPLPECGQEAQYKSRYWDMIGMGLMLIVHYLIRVRMVGTLQRDEGLTCYLSLRNLAYHPEMIGNDFWEAGKLAGRTAYGYNFFALMGEFLLPGTAHGFEWMQLFGGMAAAACLYGIFRKLFPALKPAVAWVGAFAVSVQPLFLGFSTMCGLEYGITVFFIYAFYCCMNKKYILTVFWLLMLGTTKSTGAIMAMTFAGAFLAGTALGHFANIKKSREPQTAAPAKDAHSGGDAVQDGEDEGPEIDFKSGFIAAAALLAIAVLAVVTVKICKANGIAFSWDYIGIKLAQLFILNFNWVWTSIVLIGMCMVIVNFRVRRTHKMQLVPVMLLGGCYLVHLSYLVAYTKAGLVRYNMLTDVLFAMIGICLLIKMFQRIKAVFPVIAIVGLCMFGEAFVTIDPVSAGFFSTVNTNAFPMVFTVYFAKDKPEYRGKTGDFAYYNFHYTLVERALNDIIADFDAPDGDIVLFSNYDGDETRPEDEVIVWDSKRMVCRLAAFGENVEESRKIVKLDVAEVFKDSLFPEQAIFFVTPWEIDRTESSVELLSGYYDMEGPMYAVQNHAGIVEYYYLRLK